MEKKKIIVFDKRWEGHIPTYHKLICKNLLELGYEVYSYSPNPTDVKEFINNSVEVDVTTKVSYFSTRVEAPKNNDIPSQDNIFEKPQKKKSITFKEKIIQLLKKNKSFKTYYEVLLNWRELNTILLKNHNPKECIVFIPYMDADFFNLLLRKKNIDKSMKFQWCGIIFKNNHFRNPSIKDKFLSLNLFKSDSCKGIFVLDEFIIPKLIESIGSKVNFMPDIANLSVDNTYVDTHLTIIKNKKKEGKKIFLLSGIMDDRKNLKLFLDTAKLAEEENPNWFFVVAGFTNKYYWKNKSEFEYFQSIIERPFSNILIKIDGLKDGIEYNAYLENCDCLFLAYKNFCGSSNNLTKSSFFKIPVIVNQGYLLEDRINKWEIGSVLKKETSHVLLTLLEEQKSINWSEREEKYNKYFDFHTEDKLKNTLNQIMSIQN